MIKQFEGLMPNIGEHCYVDETAVLIGDITMGKHSSVYPMAVVRADDNKVIIGDQTNVQDHVTIHESLRFPTIVGNGVSIGHGAILHGCQIGDNVLIGMHATLLDGVVIEDNCIVAAGSVCPPNKTYPANSMIMGSPAKVVRELREEEIQGIMNNAQHYVQLSEKYLRQQNHDH